jgi:hypothetical protein
MRLEELGFFLASCLLIDSCSSFKPAFAAEYQEVDVSESSDCNPPTMCSIWAECTEFCESLSWEDVETNLVVPDEFTMDDLRESCLHVCDEAYTFEEETNECSCEYCDKMCSMIDHDQDLTCH